MIYLLLAIVVNALIGVIFKIYGQRNIDTVLAIFVNYFICVVMASILLGKWAVPLENFKADWTILAIGLGFLFPIIFNLYAIAVKHLGIVTSTIFQKMSLIAPVLVGIFFYAENSGIFKVIGIFLALAAIYLIPKETDATRNKVDKKYLIFGLLVFIGSAFIDVGLLLMEKLYGMQGSNIEFLATLFLFAGLGAFPVVVVHLLRNDQSKINGRNILAGILLGIPNFFSIYFILKGLNTEIDASVFFPINNVGILICSALAGILFFYEKMNPYKYLGFAFSILAIILLSL